MRPPLPTLSLIPHPVFVRRAWSAGADHGSQSTWGSDGPQRTRCSQLRTTQNLPGLFNMHQGCNHGRRNRIGLALTLMCPHSWESCAEKALCDVTEGLGVANDTLVLSASKKKKQPKKQKPTLSFDKSKADSQYVSDRLLTRGG